MRVAWRRRRGSPQNALVSTVPAGYSTGILPQEPSLDEGKTVLGNVEEGVAGTSALIGRYNEVAAKMAADYSDDLLEELGRLQEQLDHREAWDLLLDEPANDLDVETLASLEDALGEFPGCAVITSHDRWFLDRVATHILAWEGGADWSWFEGNFASYQKNKTGRLGAEAARPHRVTYRKLTR